MKKEEFLKRYAVDRRDTASLKWDCLSRRFHDSDLIPMWVADMEFKTCDAVRDALRERVDHGVFGYTYVPDSYYKAVFDWEERHFGYRPEKSHLRLSGGVVPALYWFVNCYTRPSDAVLILAPVYYPFHNCVKDCARKLVTCGLVYSSGYWTVDLDAFERSITDNDVKMFILCSPHNPAGRVWTEKELDDMLGICHKHGVLVISDEIHQDFVFGGSRHITAPAVSGGRYADNVILVNSASKSFNLAALLNANIFISSPSLREQFDRYASYHIHTDFNIMGLTATEAAYTGGEEWLSGLRDVIQSNYDLIRSSLLAHVPGIITGVMEGTYLPMLDMRNIVDISGNPETILLNGMPVAKPLYEFTQKRCRLAVNYGSWFGSNAEGFIRLNLATVPENIEKTLANIIRECGSPE